MPRSVWLCTVAAAVAGLACQRGSTTQEHESTTATGDDASSTETAADASEDAASAIAMTSTTSSTSWSESGNDSEDGPSGTTGPGDTCPADRDVVSGGVVVLTPDWPDGSFDDVQCEALYLARGPTALVLNCMHPDTLEPVEVRMRLPEDTTDDYFTEFFGNQDLRASFFSPPPESIGCILCLHASLRDEAGELILLGYAANFYARYPAEGAAFDVGTAGWLRPGTPEYEAWSAPFVDLVVRNVGCSERESLRPGSDVETPLALQFTADDGLVSIYDRNELHGVDVAGHRFDIRVGRAFFRGPLTCGDCPVTEVGFIVLRSPPG